ncbi:MAG: polysaccharide lyase family 1 protein, partial [Lachnospira sp.]
MKKQVKKFLSMLLVSVMALASILTFDVEPVHAASASITEAAGDLETAYVEWTPVSGASGYNVYVKAASAADSAYVQLDDELIRKYPSYMRADAVGLKAGDYVMKVVPLNDGVEDTASAMVTEKLTVLAHDRSGFAFVNGTSSGAYNDDGTLKSNAKVFYMTESTKGGFVAAVDAADAGNYPLAVRLIGNITDFTGLESGDMLIGECKFGLTIEGIGEDATANGWGVRIKNSSNVEVRNLGFMNCDSTEGDSAGLQQGNDHVWIHNCDFFYGAAGSDADQVKGDGALDTKKSQYVTHSYNHFYDTGKTHLNGNGDTTLNYITYHHNWYDHSDSRHPLVRCSSAVHVYNNLYDGVSKYGMICRIGASIFSEANYFKDTQKPMLISQQGTDIIGVPIASDEGGIIKSYGNVYDNTTAPITHKDSSTSFDCYEASSRDEQVSSSYKTLKGSNTYSNFDTASDFYTYTAQSAADAKVTVEKYAGRINGGDFKWDFSDPSEDTNYTVIPELKSALTSYKTTLVSVGGGSVSTGDSGSGDSGSGDSGSGDSGSSGSGSGDTSSDYFNYFTGKK